jgi:hypothetical protein
MTPTMAPGGTEKLRSSNSRRSPKPLAQPLGLDDHVAEARARRDEDLELADHLLRLLGEQLLVGVDPRLALGVAGAGRHPDPLQLALEGLLAPALAALLLPQPLLLLLQPRGVVALPRDAVAAVELEDPAGDVVEEVAVVGDRDDGALVVLEVPLEPGHRQGVEVVGGLVEQQDVGLPDEQPAQRDPPPLAARQHVDHGVRRRAAQGVHGELESGVELPGADRLDLLLDLGLAVEHLLHLVVVHGLGEALGQGVELGEQGLGLGRALLDDLPHRLAGLERGLLLEQADRVAGRPHDLAVRGLLGPGHDAQQRALAGPVEAEDADLGAVEEAERDVAQHLLLAVGLRDPHHRENDLLIVS